MLNFLHLGRMHFDTRILLETCLINIHGETLDCVIKPLTNEFSRTAKHYAVYEKHPDTLKEGNLLLTFSSYHMEVRNYEDELIQLKKATDLGSDATLIIPFPSWLRENESIDEADFD